MTRKVWGTSHRLLLNDFCQMEKIEVVPGGYSSIHLHQRKHNLFCVQSGVLTVEVYKNQATRPADSRDLKDGDSWSIGPNTRHRFHAKSSTVAYELYWSSEGTVDPDDIVRYSENGVDKTQPEKTSSSDRILCCACNSPLAEYYTVFWQNAVRQMCGKCLEKTGAEQMTS